jgi:hypothetical protein
MLLTFTFTGKPSDARSTHKFKVHVNVAADDENTKSLMQSWIKREFRSLGDVRIVSRVDASYILNVVAVEPTLKASGRKSGDIAVGSVFFQRSVTDPDLYYAPDLVVMTDDTEDLESLCKSIVATIDTDRLESIRELFQ